MSDWWIYKGTGIPNNGIERLPEPPPWRRFDGKIIERPLEETERGEPFLIDPEDIEVVNAALYLRRPLLVTGRPGSGKSSLAKAVAYELDLGPVLYWSITTRSTLTDALYRYDAIGRLHEVSLQKHKGKDEETLDIGKYLRLGPLGTAMLPSYRPRVLLIDEIDKSDIDLPSDLLHIFERGEFEIPELTRLPSDMKTVAVMPDDGRDDSDRVPVEGGRIRCNAFPVVILTNNGEREFPPAFLRRCLRLDMKYPDKDKLVKIVTSHLGADISSYTEHLIDKFIERRDRGDLATDQLLNAVYLTLNHVEIHDKTTIIDAVLRHLTSVETL